MAGRKSYFEEKRVQYSDPNFFNRPQSIDDLIKNVRRIIKDVKYGLISDNDYIYFTNNNVINACIQTAHANMVESETIANALMYYINVGLVNGYRPLNADTVKESANAGNAQVKFNNKAQTWRAILNMFIAIQNGLDPKQCLSGIVNMQNYQINEL